jgi:hypothetical protein
VVYAEIVDDDNVGMGQRTHRFGLALEAGQVIGILGKPRGQHLQGDVAAEPRILRPINLSHAAGAQRTEDFVRTELHAAAKHGVRLFSLRANGERLLRYGRFCNRQIQVPMAHFFRNGN